MQQDRRVGHVDDFTDYQHDVRAMLGHARALGLPRPFHLLAHSMGGCIGLRAVIEGLDVRSAAFSAPMWGLQMSAALRPLAWAVSSLARRLRLSHRYAPGQAAEPYVLGAAFELNTLTSDRAMFDYMQAQLRAHPDLALGGPSLHWLNEALVEMRTLSQAASPGLPCIAFLGSEEAIVDPGRIEARMTRWPDGRLVMIEGGRHEVLMERPDHRTAIFDALDVHFAAA